MVDLPDIPQDLLQSLNESYPERCPDPSMTDREIWMYAGERRLVRRLLAAYQDQQERSYPQVLSTPVDD